MEETTQVTETETTDYTAQLDGIQSEVVEVKNYLSQIDYNTRLSNTTELFNIAILVGVGVTILLSMVFKRFY